MTMECEKLREFQEMKISRHSQAKFKRAPEPKYAPKISDNPAKSMEPHRTRWGFLIVHDLTNAPRYGII